MEAAARLRASGGRLELRSEPPLTLRATPGAVYLVSSAAGPVGGDRLRLDLEVTDGATLTVRSAAAAVHHPGPTGLPSHLDLTVRVGAHSTLRWWPEPAVFVDGCDHRMTIRIDLADTATLLWRDEQVLGRHGESGGSVRTRLHVDRAGAPLLRSDSALGPRWPDAQGPAGNAGARASGTVLVVGPHRDATTDPAVPTTLAPGQVPGSRAARLDLGPGAAIVVALAGRADVLARALDALVVPLLVDPTDRPGDTPLPSALPSDQLDPAEVTS